MLHDLAVASPAFSAGLAVDTLRALVRRELQIRYKGSLLGILWALLSPLGTVLILHFVFTRVVPLGIDHYAVFIYSGLLPWSWFQASLQTASSCLVDNRDLVRKPFFRRSILPAVVAASHFLLYLLALPVLVALGLANGVRPTPLLLLLPVVWMVQAVLTLAFTTLVAALGVLVRDVQHLLGVVLTLWFYLTPVFYDLGRVPQAQARWIRLNPMTPIVESHRALALEGRMPDWTSLLACGALGVVLLALSLALFRALEHQLIEEV